MSRFADAYCRLLAVLLFAAMALMVAMVFGNVVLRYAFNTGITVSEELSRWLFVWVTFLGAVVGIHERSHLGTDLLVSRLGPAGQRACTLASLALMIAVTLVFLHGSWAQAVINRDTEAPVTGWPMAVVYAAGVVFALSALPLLAHEFWRVARGRAAAGEGPAARDGEDGRAGAASSATASPSVPACGAAAASPSGSSAAASAAASPSAPAPAPDGRR